MTNSRKKKRVKKSFPSYLSKKKQLIHIGTFGKPLGLKGEVKINMYTSDYESFKSLNPYIAVDGRTIWNFHYLKISRGKLIGRLQECISRNCAEKLNGKKIFTNKINLTKIKKNQFYVFDLINCEVKTTNDKLLGKISNIDNFGAGDLINIKQSNGINFFIPINKENVVKVNIKKKLVTVNPIKGILD